MFLRYLDAFCKNHSYVKELSTIAIIGTTVAAAAISAAFARSKGSGSARGDVSTAHASLSGAWLSVRSGQSVAHADDGSGMPSCDGIHCPCLRGLFAFAVHRSQASW